LSTKLEDLYQSSHLYGSNAPFIEAYYEDWLEDKNSVPQHWAGIFSKMLNGSLPVGESETGHLEVQEKFRAMGRLPSAITADSRLADHKEAGVLKLLTTYRLRGHQAANISYLKRQQVS
jgi:2-oxoglutarate dehydrogenase E1 component